MKSRTKIKMIRLPSSFESQERIKKWNSWNIGDVGYIEGVSGQPLGELVIVLGNRIIICGYDAVEVIEE